MLPVLHHDHARADKKSGKRLRHAQDYIERSSRGRTANDVDTSTEGRESLIIRASSRPRRWPSFAQDTNTKTAADEN